VSDYLDEVEAQLVALTERGAHRRLRLPGTGGFVGDSGPGGPGGGRRRWGADLFALGAAVAVVGVVVAIVLSVRPMGGKHTPARTGPPPVVHHLTITSNGQHPPRRAPSHGPTTAPVPPFFQPRSFTAIGELTWWLLGDESCTKGVCTTIVRTTDGGQHFFQIPAPAVPVNLDSGISQLRFANRRDGFAYASELWSTHDGGADWHAIAIGSVIDLAPSGGSVYAIVRPTRGGSPVLMKSPVGQDGWSVVKAAGTVTGGLSVHGNEVLVAAGGDTFALSLNGGSTFNRVTSPEAGAACQLDEHAPSTIWALCSTAHSSKLWRSTNGGQSFTSASAALGTTLGPGAVFATADANTAVVGSGALYQTADGGQTWTKIYGTATIFYNGGTVDWQYLGFTDSTHGVALATPVGGTEQLFYTIDAGNTYHLVPIGG
jgi:hypothetical protein